MDLFDNCYEFDQEFKSLFLYFYQRNYENRNEFVEQNDGFYILRGYFTKLIFRKIIFY